MSEQMEQQQPVGVKWLRLAVTLLIFLAASVLLGYVFANFRSRFGNSIFASAWAAYGAVFLITLVINLSVLPLPFALSVMIAASTQWNPVLVALSGSLGASLGEFSSYFAGYLGKRVAIPGEAAGYRLMQRWMKKYGAWAIAFLSFQPILPFEIGGVVAGIAKMPVRRFLPAIWLGKFPKYLILIYAGERLFRLIPYFRH